MKVTKKFLNTSCVLTSLSLLTVSLTSCVTNSIDGKYKIDLNDDGFIFTNSNKDNFIGDVSYSTAVKNALSRSDDWQTFKTALANELVYQWFMDRTDINNNNHNEDFKFDLEKYKKEVDKTYDEKIQSCKSLYGTDYNFYFKNIYLAPNGGTVNAYKHKLLVDKIANNFADKVFNNSYFSLCMDDNSHNMLYPNIYAKAEKNVDINKVRNPKYWNNIGFYARSANNFFIDDVPKSYDDVNVNWLAKHPDGDYAMVQQYTFDKWFDIEKPFFSDAALFKYSSPKYVANGKLSGIYNGSFAGVTISENADDEVKEDFPFFGANPEKNSTKKFKSFLEGLKNSDYYTSYFNDDKQKIESNGTFSISLENTDDSQSVLLCLGKQMFGSTASSESSNALYTPYALAAGNLLQNLLNNPNNVTNIANVLPAEKIYNNIKYYDNAKGIDNPSILANFWYTDEHGWNPLPINNIKSYINLGVCYDNLPTTNDNISYFHCPIFNNKSSDFTWFYGSNTMSGVQYITNAVQINDFSVIDPKNSQPWIMELNQSGMHIQTIDGYNYIKEYGSTKEKRLEALKNIVKYRLFQKEVDSAANNCISAQMYGENGFLKTYFKNNFADLVIGMALDKTYNIFRKIDSYKQAKTEQEKEDNLFLYKIYSLDNEKMGNAYVNFCEYLNIISSYDVLKKEYEALDNANKKIYDYRQTQISNSKEKIGENRTIGANGLLAPIVYSYNKTNLSTHDYDSANRIIIMDIQENDWPNLQELLNKKIEDIRKSKFIEDATNSSIKPNAAHAFSPQIKQAKQDELNRFYFKSLIVDQLMYNSTGAVQANANEIKFNCYNWYQKYINKGVFLKDNFEDIDFIGKYILNQDVAKQAFISTYKRNKLIGGIEKRLSNYSKSNPNMTAYAYWNVLNAAFDKNLHLSTIYNGKYNDDCTNLELFKATVMYLLSPNNTTYNKPFDRFYEILDTRISDDDVAFAGYLTKGYANLNSQPITDLTTNDEQNNIYNFSADVDNIFDQTHMAGGEPVNNMKAVKQSGDKYWNVVNKKWNVDGKTQEKQLSGFLGIQSNWSNQLSGQLQTDVFNSFDKITTNSYDLSKKNKKYSELSQAKDAQYYGCFHKFAGEKNSNGEYYKFSVSYDGVTISEQDFINSNNQEALKLAYKIANCSYFSDLKQWAENIAKAYPGYSYFKEIVSDNSSYYSNIDKLKIDMLKLLPCGDKASEHANSIECFKRLKNVEVHTNQINPKYAYINSSNNTAYRLMLTQINKSDLIERKLTPIFNNATKQWELAQDCPLTEAEFWNVLFQLASESSVQELCIANVVDNAFGSEKLIVHDARVYNQFNAAWIKNWAKKPIDETYV